MQIIFFNFSIMFAINDYCMRNFFFERYFISYVINVVIKIFVAYSEVATSSQSKLNDFEFRLKYNLSSYSDRKVS